jgi:hypothetical protein
MNTIIISKSTTRLETSVMQKGTSIKKSTFRMYGIRMTIILLTGMLTWQCSKKMDSNAPQSVSSQNLKESLNSGTQNIANAVTAISKTYGYKIINLNEGSTLKSALALDAGFQDSITLAKISGVYEYQPSTYRYWCFSCFTKLFKRTGENQDSFTKEDLTDLVNIFLGSSVRPSDAISKRFFFSCLPAVAYSTHTKLIGIVGTNAVFYTDNPQRVNMSVLNVSPSYTGQHQLMFPIQESIWTRKNSFTIQGNLTYFKFPEKTYGLGETIRQHSINQLSYDYVKIRQAVLKQTLPHLYVGPAYNLDYHWNIRESVAHVGLSDFERYGKTKRSVSSGFAINVLFDNRKNPINPQQGFYGKIDYRSNIRFLGSDSNWQSLMLDFRSYIKLADNSNQVLAFWSYNLFTLYGSPPYLDLPSNGWEMDSNQGRGYVQSRFRGRNLLSLESEYRFGLLQNGLLGGVLFANAQSLPNWPGNRVTGIIPGAGMGLRIKLNKYSNTNIALDYGIGVGRSRAVFINLGEAF